jgi:hypothetical protein
MSDKLKKWRNFTNTEIKLGINDGDFDSIPEPIRTEK